MFMSSRSLVTGIFADTDALAGWEASLKSLNEAAVNIIQKFITDANLEDVFDGNKMDGFDESLQDCMKDAIDKHTDLEDFSGFLENVIISMENR